MNKEQARGIVSKLRLAEKLALCTGGLVLPSIPRFNIDGKLLGLDKVFVPTEPSALALGCSFSAETCRAVSERRARNCAGRIAGAIGAGLITEPMKADAVEFFSEDPFLTATLLDAYSSGGGYVFYGALGQGEYNIRTVDPRALNELYLYPLMTAGKNAAALMLDGGTLGGEKVDSSRKFFDAYAAMLSDNAAVFSRGENLTGAYIVRVGGESRKFERELSRTVTRGEVSESMVDKTAIRTLMFEAEYASPNVRVSAAEESDVPEHEIFADTAVMLKNEFLPVTDGNIVFYGDADYFDDVDFDVREFGAPVSDGAAVFLLTDCRNGIDKEIADALEIGAENRKTVAVFCGGAAVPLEMPKMPQAILFCPYITSLGALTSLLRGEISPRGHLPFTWCGAQRDYPRGNPRFDDRGDYRYESVYNGYAYFNNFAPQSVLFPFGHGLDYTEYGIKNVRAACRDRKIAVECDVENIGGRRGCALVQCYATCDTAAVYGFKKRLVGFSRVMLESGETKHIAVSPPEELFEVYDAANAAFVPIGGKVVIEVGLSSTDIRGSATVKVTSATVKPSATATELPTYFGVHAAAGKPFCPSAPELEKLFGAPFIVRPNLTVSERPRMSKSDARKLKKRLSKRLAARMIFRP